ncbi:MAG: isoprenylcysteine carboxylmethyltransferase family protein [Bryobacteraceae bacterium]
MTVSLLFRILYGAWIVSEVIVALVTRTRGSKGNVRDRGSMLLLWIVIVAAITACEWISAVVTAPLFGGGHWLRLASLIVLVAGIAIRWTAIFNLGKSFSANVAIRHEQELKKTGLYRFVRHPSYSGLLLVLLAIGLHSRNWAGLLVLLIPATAALIYRIHIEESALCQAFGEQYAEYSKATRRLVPGLY